MNLHHNTKYNRGKMLGLVLQTVYEQQVQTSIWKRHILSCVTRTLNKLCKLIETMKLIAYTTIHRLTKTDEMEYCTLQ